MGKRYINILHTRLRLGCSNLNVDKALIGISNTELCECGGRETVHHYLLDCGIELRKRVQMLDSIMDVLLDKGLSEEKIDELFKVELLLKGSDELTLEENVKIFGAVHLFLEQSNRFS